MFKRIFPVILTVSLLVFCFIIPAFAECLDYNDYITSIRQDPNNPDNILVYVSLPLDVHWNVTDLTTGDSWPYAGNTITHYVAQGHKYSVWFSSFGDAAPWGSGWTGNYLDISGLPASTVLEQVVYCDFNGGIVLDGMSARAYFSSANSSESVYSYQPNGDGFVFSFVLDGQYTDFFTQQYFIDTVASGSADMVMSFTSSTLIISLNELYFEYQQNGSNKDLIDSIGKKLDQQGQTIQGVLDAQTQANNKLDSVIDQQEQTNDQLGDIMNDQVEPEPPAGSDKVDDYQQAENELLDSVQGGSNEFDEVSVNAWDRIFTYSQSFMAFGVLFKLFADIPIIQSLLYVSLTLGAFAFMLNLSSNFGSALGRSTRQRQAAERYRVAADRRRGRG